MTSIRDEGNRSSPQAGPARPPDSRGPSGEPLARLFALLPSSEHLETVAGRTDVASRERPDLDAGPHAVTVDVPRALLDPLASLPSFVALDTVRARASTAQAAAE